MLLELSLLNLERSSNRAPVVNLDVQVRLIRYMSSWFLMTMVAANSINLDGQPTNHCVSHVYSYVDFLSR